METVASRAVDLGLTVSERTVRRVLSGRIEHAREMSSRGDILAGREVRGGVSHGGLGDGVELRLSEEEIEEIAVILKRAAGARFLEVGSLSVESRGGSLRLRARVTEPEEEYE